MLPYLFEWNGFKIPTYGFVGGLGFILLMETVERLAKREGLSKSRFSWAVFLSCIGAFVGARVFYLLANWRTYASGEASVLDFSSGYTFYGGVIGGIVAEVGLARLFKISLRKLLDFTSIAVVSGFAVARWGCVGAGCCHGRPTNLPWGMRFNSEFVTPELRGVSVHPTQIYESLLCAGLALFLLRSLKKQGEPGRFEGDVFLRTLILYGMGRLVIELFRGDTDRGTLLWLSTSQAVAVVTLALCSVALYFGTQTRKAT